MILYTHALKAIGAAAAAAPACVGWKGIGFRTPGLGHTSGWIVYDPKNGAPPGVEPELFVAGSGVLPVALTPQGVEVLASVLREAAR